MTALLERAIDRLYRYRLTILVLIQVTLIVAANQAAFWLRFDGHVPAAQQPYDTALLPLLLCVRLAVFFPLRLHRGLWRYASIWDLRNIVVGVTLSSVLFWAITHGALRITQYPRSVFIIDAVLLICLMGGVRLGRRLYVASLRQGGGRHVLIYGAGDAGEMIVRDMKNNADHDYQPIGFVDDDLRKVGARIHGVPVLGTRRDLSRIVETHQPHEVLVAMPSASASIVRDRPRARAVQDPHQDAAEPARHRGRRGARQPDPQPADRRSAGAAGGWTQPQPLERLVKGKRVLVTGAGGSIGSELCRQIAQLEPETLTLFERYENGLFAVANDPGEPQWTQRGAQ